MKISCLIALLGLAPFGLVSAQDDASRMAHDRQDAIKLLRQGRLEDTKQKLNSSLPAAALPAANQVKLGRQWVSMAFHFYDRGEFTLARQAAAEALALAAIAARSNDESSERASFLSNTGLMCERILKDVRQAKTYYDAAVVAQPNDQRAKQLQSKAAEKINPRANGKVPNS